MVHGGASRHGVSQPPPGREVSDSEGGSGLLQLAAFFGRPDQRDDVVTATEQLADQVTSDEAGATGDEGAHRWNLPCGSGGPGPERCSVSAGVDGLYIADTNNHRIAVADWTTGTVRTLIGD